MNFEIIFNLCYPLYCETCIKVNRSFFEFFPAITSLAILAKEGRLNSNEYIYFLKTPMEDLRIYERFQALQERLS